MKRYLVVSLSLFCSCMDNGGDPQPKTEFDFNRIEGELFECVKGTCDTQYVQNAHAYGERMDSATGLQFPGILPKISRVNGTYYLDFIASKITQAMQVPCRDFKTDSLTCPWGKDTLTLGLFPEKLEIPHYVFRRSFQGMGIERYVTGAIGEDDHFDSLVASGSYDTLLLFKGNFIYE